MNIPPFFAAFPLAFPLVAAVLGLLVGSFLNVVIHRFPQMLERRWRAQCSDLTGTHPVPIERYDLIQPRSRCPHCGHHITALENIPVLSFLWLRGKCSACSQSISLRYPVIELVTGVMSAAVAGHFGFGAAALGGLIFTWILIALTFIDIDHQLLPDDITLPLIWLGLGLNIAGVFTTLSSAVIGAIAGYVSLWLVYHVFKLVTGKEGMGYGDFKLFAALGAWLGWQSLPLIILFSSFIGALVGISFILFFGRERGLPIPFGPFLCAAGWVGLMWGDVLTRAYLQFARF